MRAEQVELPVAVRTEIGTAASRRLRAQGLIPAVVYGQGREPVVIAVNAATFAKAVPATGWYSTLISLEIEGEGGGESPTVMVKEVQRDLVRRQIISIDFRRVSLREAVETQVPIRHTGESPGVKLGGILDQVTHEVMVQCLPTDMPDHLEVDISGLEIADSVRVRDLTVPAGVKVLAAEDDVVIVIAPPLREEEITPAVEEEEGALVEEVAEPEVVGETEPEAEERQQRE
jgi:large subunit ribosomal protein L25